MNISSDNGEIDSSKFIDYIKKQFPTDLAQMIVLRDELAKRQGALSAVEDANTLRLDADSYAKSVKAEADVNLAQAKEANNASKELKKALETKEVDLNGREGQYEKDLAAFSKSVESQKKAVADAEASIAKAQVALQTKQDQIDADRTALDARIKSFQAKVASLEV